MNKKEHQESRRDFLKKAAYTAPVILTMAAAPAFATYGSAHMDYKQSSRVSHKGSHKGMQASRVGHKGSHKGSHKGGYKSMRASSKKGS